MGSDVSDLTAELKFQASGYAGRIWPKKRSFRPKEQCDILARAGQSMLTQANQLPQGVLALLR